MKTELIKIVSNLLRSNCIYERNNRNGWICGFGNGRISYIEDHQHELLIKAEKYTNCSDIISKELIDDIVNIKSISATGIISNIGVWDKNSHPYTFTEPSETLMKLAKEKCWFGKESVTKSIITDSDIEIAVDNYYSNREKEHKKLFS